MSARTIHHHPSETMLADYATGAIPTALALIVGGHLHFCPSCRDAVAELEAVGGELLAHLRPVAIAEGALAACLSRLDKAEVQAPVPAASDVPPPLRPHAPAGLAALPWQDVGGYFDEARLPGLDGGYRTSFIRVRGGRHVPEHGHEANEYMLVLAGGYTSGGAHYTLGDVAICGGDEPHTPVADEGEDCICLLVLDAPLAFTGDDGRALAPLLRV